MNTGLSHDEAGWFARFHCDCGLDRLVAFSCKGRGYAVHCIGGASARVAAGAGRPPQRAESARRGLRDDRTGRAPGGQRLGLDVDFHVGPRVVGVRVVVLPGREAAMTRLCTNLPRTPFPPDLVGRLYTVPLADRTLFQGVDVVREPASVRHRERAHGRRPDLGEPVRRGSQTLPRPRGAACRGDLEVDTSRRDVRTSQP